METKLALDNLDGFAVAEEDDDTRLIVTATDDFEEAEEGKKGYIAFNIQIGAKTARFLALKGDVKEFFQALKKMHD